MNNKILLGSIIAIVILVLVSFTGVVGYQTTKSSTIARASPLFKVRTSRAIDKESKELTCDYVGKGEEINIPLPIRDSRNVYLQKAIRIINKMDEERYNILLKQVKSRLGNYNNTEIFISKLTESLGELKESKNQNMDLTNRCGPTLGFDIIDCSWYFTAAEGPLLGFDCIMFILILIPGFITTFIIFFITFGGFTGFICYPPM